MAAPEIRGVGVGGSGHALRRSSHFGRSQWLGDRLCLAALLTALVPTARVAGSSPTAPRFVGVIPGDFRLWCASTLRFEADEWNWNVVGFDVADDGLAYSVRVAFARASLPASRRSRGRFDLPFDAVLGPAKPMSVAVAVVDETGGLLAQYEQQFADWRESWRR